MAANRESMLLASEARGTYGATNLGQLIGLHGLGSLVPFMAMWAVVCGVAVRILRNDRNNVAGR
jgi:hypothetical protein